MRAVRALLIVLVVLVVVAVIGDSVARRAAEDRLATGIRTSQRLAELPGVSIGGAPFLLEAARGRYDDVSLSLGQVAVPGGLRLTSVDARLTGVTAPVSALTSGDATLPDVRADAVTAQALVSYAELRTAFTAGLPKGVTGLALSQASGPGDVRVRLTYTIYGVSLPIDVPVHLAVQGQKLTVTAAASALTGVPAQLRQQAAQVLSFSTALPALPYGLAISGLTVRSDGIALAATGHDVRLGAAPR